MTETVQKVSLLLAHEMDDSYTPASVALRAGTGPNDMQDVRIAGFDKPNGWIDIDLSTDPLEDTDTL